MEATVADTEEDAAATEAEAVTEVADAAMAVATAKVEEAATVADTANTEEAEHERRTHQISTPLFKCFFPFLSIHREFLASASI